MASKVEPIKGNMAKYRKFVNFGNNPKPLHLDNQNGEYIQEQLKQIKRVYLANKSSYHEKRGQITVIHKKISHRVDNPRSRYCRLMNKYERTPEEQEQLYINTAELESLYNQLPALERHVRDTGRSLMLRYPISLMEKVYEGLGESFEEEKEEEYYKGVM